MRGEQGERGSDGAPGLQGPPGPPGRQGNKGAFSFPPRFFPNFHYIEQFQSKS